MTWTIHRVVWFMDWQNNTAGWDLCHLSLFGSWSLYRAVSSCVVLFCCFSYHRWISRISPIIWLALWSASKKKNGCELPVKVQQSLNSKPAKTLTKGFEFWYKHFYYSICPFIYKNVEITSEDVHFTNKNHSKLLNIGIPLFVTYSPSICLPGSMSKFLLN